MEFKVPSSKLLISGIAALSLLGVGCSKGDAGFSMLTSSQAFQQQSVRINNKIDILWVVDNSGSMGPMQTNLRNNFTSFINRFVNEGFDYRMAVIGSDTYRALSNYRNDPALAAFRGGWVTPADPISTFLNNVTTGTSGSGDERPFQSFMASLDGTANAGFRRSDAFLAIVILSDEDDFSSDTRAEGAGTTQNYNEPTLWTISNTISRLDTFTGYAGGTARRNYSVSAITVLDQACKQSQWDKGVTATLIGTRYIELVNQTGGITGSLCDTSYATSLNFIQQSIIDRLTRFELWAEPNPATIVVTVAGISIPQSSTCGWTYESATNEIVFHGDSTCVPSATDDIAVRFDPARLR